MARGVVVIALLACCLSATVSCGDLACSASCERKEQECREHQDPGVPGDQCGDLRAACEQECDEQPSE